MGFKLKTTSEHLYYYVLILLLINNWWGDLQVFQGIYLVIKPLVLGGAIVITLALTIKEKYIFAELLIATLLITIGAYTSYVTGSKWTLYSMILVAFAKNINIGKVLHIIYVCMSVFLLISVSIFIVQYTFGLSSLMISEDMTKYSMTFIGANEAARYWIFWFALYLYINADKKISAVKKILIFTGTIFFYVFTRSDALIMVFVMGLLKYLERKRIVRKFIQKCARYSFLIMWLLSLFILKFEKTTFFDNLNRLVTGRFSLGLRGLETYGISVFGQPELDFFHWVNSTQHASYRLVVDNAFYMIMIQYGIFYLVLIAFLFLKSKNNLDYKGACCLIAYSIFSLAENTILSPTAIFPVIIAANASWKVKKEHADIDTNVLFGHMENIYT